MKWYTLFILLLVGLIGCQNTPPTAVEIPPPTITLTPPTITIQSLATLSPSPSLIPSDTPQPSLQAPTKPSSTVTQIKRETVSAEASWLPALTPTQEFCLVASIVSVGIGLNIRASNNTNSEIIGVFSNGDFVIHRIYDPNDVQGFWEWVQIDRGDFAGGWVVRNLLRVAVECLL